MRDQHAKKFEWSLTPALPHRLATFDSVIIVEKNSFDFRG